MDLVTILAIVICIATVYVAWMTHRYHNDNEYRAYMSNPMAADTMALNNESIRLESQSGIATNLVNYMSRDNAGFKNIMNLVQSPITSRTALKAMLTQVEPTGTMKPKYLFSNEHQLIVPEVLGWLRLDTEGRLDIDPLEAEERLETLANAMRSILYRAGLSEITQVASRIEDLEEVTLESVRSQLMESGTISAWQVEQVSGLTFNIDFHLTPEFTDDSTYLLNEEMVITPSMTYTVSLEIEKFLEFVEMICEYHEKCSPTRSEYSYPSGLEDARLVFAPKPLQI